MDDSRMGPDAVAAVRALLPDAAADLGITDNRTAAVLATHLAKAWVTGHHAASVETAARLIEAGVDARIELAGFDDLDLDDE